MYCNNCGKEISDNHNFCSYCGASVEIPNKKAPFINFCSKKKLNGVKYFLISLILFSVIFFATAITIFLKSPEYSIYASITAMKENDYNKTIKYINIEKIINNRFQEITSEMMNDSELANNPFAGLAYMFIEAFKPKFVSLVQDSFKDIVESPDNVFQELSKPKLLAFLLIKNYNGITLTKTLNEPKKATFVFNNNKDINNLQINLNKTSDNIWEIVDISGYNFWEN